MNGTFSLVFRAGLQNRQLLSILHHEDWPITEGCLFSLEYFSLSNTHTKLLHSIFFTTPSPQFSSTVILLPREHFMSGPDMLATGVRLHLRTFNLGTVWFSRPTTGKNYSLHFVNFLLGHPIPAYCKAPSSASVSWLCSWEEKDKTS